MKTGIIGLPQAGKTTIFEALTGNCQVSGHKEEPRLATVNVPDQRVQALTDMFRPRKTTYAQVEYFLPQGTNGKKDQDQESATLTQVRQADALIHVVRNFTSSDLTPPPPRDVFHRLDQELTLADLIVAEKRLERLALDIQRGKKIDQEEMTLIQSCHQALNQEVPLRKAPELAEAPRLRGFAFLSAKPLMVLVNNDDEDVDLPDLGELGRKETCLTIRGKLERELAQMSVEEVQEFMEEFKVTTLAGDLVIKQTYELLGMISFFTVGEDEVKAWTIHKDTPALEAAAAIHSDIKKGFIRAEVVAYADLMAAGSLAEARKRGTVRLEGKTYQVQDGDVINFRFNV